MTSQKGAWPDGNKPGAVQSLLPAPVAPPTPSQTAPPSGGGALLTLDAEHLSEFESGSSNFAERANNPQSVRLRQERVRVQNRLFGA